MQRLEGRRLAVPEATTGPAHVPVGQVVGEGLQPRTGRERVEVLQVVRHVPYELVRHAEQPAVEHVPLRGSRGVARGPAVGPRVQGLERDRVPVGEQHLAGDLGDRRVPDPARRPRRSARGHEPAHGVRTLVVHERDRLEDVAEMLAHLAAVLGEDVAEAEDVLVRALVECQRRHGHQRVEPATRLVDRLADEVGGEGLLELLRRALRVRVAPLRERHRARVEPGVDDLRDAGRRLATGRAGERHVVHVRAVRVERVQVLVRQLGQLSERPDTDLVVVLTTPDGQRRAPVARSRQGPVDVVVQPVAVPAVLDRVRVPVRGLVLPQQRVLDLRRAHVPGRLCVVQQHRVAAPAVRVAVLVGEHPVHQAAVLKVLHEHRVGGLEEQPTDERYVLAEGPVRTDRVDQRQPVLPARQHVVLAERGRLVDQAGAVLGGDVVGEQHVVRSHRPRRGTRRDRTGAGTSSPPSRHPCTSVRGASPRRAPSPRAAPRRRASRCRRWRPRT